jgi:hypothetical protein
MRPVEVTPSADVPRQPVSPPSGARERRCGGCGRGNDPRRELCAVCGADLDTGLPLLLGHSGRGVGQSLPGPGPRTRTLLTLAVLAALAVAVVLLLVGLGLGPFAPQERLGPAELLRAGYPGDPVVLAVETVATTSTASAPDRDLSPLNLIDGDGLTAWVGLPVDGQDGGEVIELVLERPAWVTRIQFRNGDHRSSDAYERSGRLQRGLITFDGRREHRIDLLDIGRQAQVIELPAPELTTRVIIRVDQVFPGSGLRGVALSEVSLIGWTADSADAALARQRSQQR